MAEKIKPTQEAKLNRKGNKPQMEKRRRARINHHLEQLAGLLFEGRKKDSNRHSKLEKADILEMTVRHVKELQNRLNLHSITSDPNLHSRYRIGFTECASEVSRYLSTAESIDEGVRNRITDHLVNSIHVDGGIVDQQQDSNHVSPLLENRTEINIENISDSPVSKPEPAIKQELLSPVSSRSTPSPNTNAPMKSLHVTIPNSLNLSRFTIPVLGSTNKTLLSPQTAAITLGEHFPDSLTRSENCKPQPTAVTTVPNLGISIPKTSEAQTTIDNQQTRGQFFHQPKPSISVQPFLTTVRTAPNPPTEIVRTTPPLTKPMEKPTSSVAEPWLVKLSPSQVAGSFQIIPGSLYNGQPVALYLAPTATLPTAQEYITPSITNAQPTVTTTTSTTKSETLSIQMPQVVTAVVSPPTFGLLSPHAATPAPTNLSGSTYFNHVSSKLPLSATVSTSIPNPSTFPSTSDKPLPVVYHQRIETISPVSSLHTNNIQPPESGSSVWRPW